MAFFLFHNTRVPLFCIFFGEIRGAQGVFFHVYPPVGEKGDALICKQGALDILTAKGKGGGGAAVAHHNAVAGDDAGLGISVQSVANHTRHAWVSCRRGNTSVGHNRPARNAPYNCIDFIKFGH